VVITVQIPACTKFSLSNPADFCEENPKVVTSCFVNGDGSTGLDALVGYNYDDRLPMSNISSNVDNPVTLDHIAYSDEIGAVWGLAYQRTDEIIYAATYYKGNTAIGPEGMDAIYMIDPNTNSVIGHFNLSDFGTYSGSLTDPRPYALPSDPLVLATDSLLYSLAGNTSLGDLDISEDGKTLSVVNLEDKTVVQFDISNPLSPILTGKMA